MKRRSLFGLCLAPAVPVVAFAGPVLEWHELKRCRYDGSVFEECEAFDFYNRAISASRRRAIEFARQHRSTSMELHFAQGREDSPETGKDRRPYLWVRTSLFLWGAG